MTHTQLAVGLAALAMMLVAALAAIGSDVPAALTNAVSVAIGGIFASGVAVGADGLRQSAHDKRFDQLNERLKTAPAPPDTDQL
jgi:hypothetical protein